MKVCSRCKETMDDTAFFCGKCGAYFESTQPYIIDGKKEIKKRKYFKNGFETKKGSIISLIIFSVFFALSVFLIIDSIFDIMPAFSNYAQMFEQFSAKSKYILEGLPLRYILKEITFMSDIISNFLIILAGTFLGIYCLYNMFVYSYNIHLHNKLGDYYTYNNPIRLLKVTRKIRFVFIIIASVLLFLLLCNILVDLFIAIL